MWKHDWCKDRGARVSIAVYSCDVQHCNEAGRLELYVHVQRIVENALFN